MKYLRSCRTTLGGFMTALVAMWQIGASLNLSAATVFLDNNGATVGSGIMGGSTITWDASTIWGDSAGTGTVAAWNAGDIATFSAGGDSGNPFTVTVSGTQSIGGLVFEEGRVTLTGGTLQLATNSSFNVATNLTATVNSTIDGAFDLTKTGAGTLVLGGTNTYTGKTLINAGVLSISSDANLGAAPGGVLADSINFTGSSTLQVTGTGNPTINTNRGITIGNTFTGTVQVVDPANTLTYSGAITGIAGTTFQKTGAGTLDLQGNNTASLTGTLNIDGGTLKLSGNGEMAGTSSVTIGNRGAFTLDNTATNLADRTAGAITSNGGTINFIANAAATTETLGVITLNAGALTINSTAGAGGSTLTIPTLTRSVAGGTLYMNGTGLGGGTNQVVLGTAPALINNILKYAVVNDGTLISFANYTTSGGSNQTVKPLALASHNQGAETTWVATDNVRPTADVTNASSRSLYTLTLDSGIDILGPTGDRNLTIGGAILQTGGVSVVNTGATTTNGTNFLFGANEAIFHILGSLQLNRGSDNTSLVGSGGFTKSGSGTLILNGVSTLTGAFNVNEGVLELRGGTSLMSTATTVNLNGATLRLSNDSSTTYTGNLQVNADSTVQVDRVTAAATVTTHTLGTLSIGGGRTLSVNSNDITAGTAYGLTLGAVTLTGAATLDVANNGAGLGTLTISTVTGAFPLTKTGAGDLVLSNVSGVYSGLVDIQGGRVGWSPGSGTLTESSVFSGAGGLIKSGNGAVNLTAANTFTGGVTITGGTLGFSTVSNNGGAASNLGQGTDGITLNGGTLSFIGNVSQSTNRQITQTAASTLSANGTGGATITYNGAITGGAFNFTLTGTSGSAGLITSGIVTTGATDATVNGGTWTLTGTTTVGDDLVVSGVNTILNLNSTGALAYNAGASGDASLLLRDGAVVNIGANDAIVAADFDRVFLGQDADGATPVLNMNTFNLTSSRLILGERVSTRSGIINGTGTLTITGGDIDLYRGTINAKLASTGTTALEKFGTGTVTLAGDNSGLASTGATIVYEGTLVLDYTADNNTKIRAASQLDMRGGTLILNGNNGAATSQTVASLTLASGGNSKIIVNGGTGQDAVLNLGAITRSASGGAIRFELPTGAQSATRGITTSTLNSNGLLGLSGYATVKNSTGTWFATNATNLSGGNIVALTSTAKNVVSTWLTGDHITDETTGFTGTLNLANINSLRFNAAGGSSLNLASPGVLGITSGGILVTDQVTSGTPGIYGGTLTSSVAEVIVTQDSAQTFEISSNLRASNAITKSGSGTLLLSGKNVYTGQTRVQNGILRLSGGNAIGDTSLVTLATTNNATLELLDDEVIGRLAGGQNNTNGVYGLVAIGDNTLTTDNTAGSTTYAGLITGSSAGVLIKKGSNNLQLTGISSGFTGSVIVDRGLLYFSSTGRIDASSFTINAGGSLMIDNNGTTRSGTRILDNATITLNSANGVNGTGTIPQGLWIRTDQDGTLDETVGVVTAASGASYVSMEATTTNDDSDLIMNNLLRTNKATLNIRGTNLGSTNAQNNQFRIGDATNQANFIANTANLVGGAGVAGNQNIKIVPWAIGETTAGGLAVGNMGNSLVTYVSGAGFRPLDFSNEYDTYTAGAADDNIRQSLTADLTGLAGKTINSLVIDTNNITTINVTGTGAGQTLTNTSGAFLFTISNGGASTAYNTILGGFDTGITVGSSTNEYVFHVVNPSSDPTTPTLTATVTSPLTSTADITKSGRGTLILSGTNTAGGNTRKTTINEGTLEIADLDNIGGNTGELVFAGGTLKFGLSFDTSLDDLSTRTISFLNGGGTLDTNGKNATFANTLGSGTGTLTKTGTGNLTLNATTAHTGGTVIAAGTVTLGANQAIGTGALTVSGATTVLAMGSQSATVAGLTLTGNGASITGPGATLTVNGDAIINNSGSITPKLSGTMNLINVAATTLTLGHAGNDFTGYYWGQFGTASILNLANAGNASGLGAATGDNAAIRLGLTTATAGVQIAAAGTGGTTDRPFWLTGTTGGGTIDNDGTGALTLNGDILGTEYGAKTLTLQGATTGFSNVVNGVISNGLGTLSLTKAEASTWSLMSANTFTGATTISAGVLHLGNANAVQNSAVAVNAANGMTFASGIGTFNMASIAGTGALALTDTAAAPVTVVAGSNNANTTYSGTISGAGGVLVKTGTGTLTLSGPSNSFSGGLKVKAGTVFGNNAGNNNFGTGTITLGDTVANSANVTLTGFIGNAVIANPIVLESGTTGTITLATTNGTTPYTYSGGITGSNHLTVAANATQTLTFSNLVNNAGTITNAGIGTGTTTISGGVGANVTGITQTSATSAFVLSGPNSYSGATTVTAGTLSITGALNNPGSMTGITVNGGATLNLINGTGVPLSSLTTLNLGAGTGTATLGLEIGASSDLLTVTGAATTANSVLFNLAGVSGLSAGTYNLLTATGGGLSAATYSLNAVPGGFTYTLNPTDTVVQLIATAVSGNLYWRGSINNSWATNNAGSTNWTTDLAGTLNANYTPGAGNTVIFSASTATGPAITTTLDSNVLANNLLFTAAPVGVTSVTIAAGTPSTSSLTIAPGSSTVGIDVADDAGDITISAPVIAGADQTWNVVGTGANGSSLTVSGGLSGSGDITKTGAGMLTITAVNSAYNGDLIWSGGALTITPTGAGANNLVFNGIISGSGSGPLLKNGTGILVLNGANTYSGGTTLDGGITILGNKQAFGSDAVTTSTNTPTLQAGVNLSGVNKVANAFVLNTNLTVSGTNNLEIGGTTTISGNNRSITNNLTGPAVLTLSGNVILGETGFARNLTVNGTGATVINGTVVNGGAANGWLVKGGTGTLTLGAANSYTGFTIVDQGSMILAAGVNQNMTNTFYFGSSAGATTAGTLDLSNASATFTATTAFWNQINSTTNTPAIIIGAGQSLNLNGNVLIGNNSSSPTPPTVITTTTLMTASGLGTINVTNLNSGASFRVGGYSGSTVGSGNRANADLSGLAAMNISLNTTNGIVAVSNSGTVNTSGIFSTLTLPGTTNITAKTLSVGEGGQNAGLGQVNQLKLGNVASNFNVDVINIGTGQRDLGSITFNTGSGTLTVHGVAGATARTAFNMAAAGGATGVTGASGNTFDVTGHTANLMLGAVAIGTQNRGAISVNTFSFDQGTLDMTSLTLSTRSANASTGTGPYTTTSTVNFGGGDVDIQNGILQAGQVSSGTNTHSVTADINISGTGTVDIGNTAGTSIQMASSSTATGTASSTIDISGGTTTLTGGITMATATVAGGSATGSLTITGGSVSVGGNISRGGGAGTTSATVTLNGGTLNMSGKNIGDATNVITFNAESGTLKNLAELNGGGPLVKTTTGTLVLEGTNAYQGATNVSAGNLQVGRLSAGTTSVSSIVTVNGSGAILSGTGTVQGATTVTMGTIRPGDTGGTDIGTLNLQSGLTFNPTGASTVAEFTINGTTLSNETGDLINVTGALTLNSDSNFVVTNGGSWTPTVGQSWTLLNWTGLTTLNSWSAGTNLRTGNNGDGNEGNLDLVDITGIGVWDISQFTTTGTISIAAVPEPGRMLLLGFGLMALLFRRRRCSPANR